MSNRNYPVRLMAWNPCEEELPVPRTAKRPTRSLPIPGHASDSVGLIICWVR